LLKFWTLSVFERPLWWVTYDDHLRFIEKRVVGFTLVLIELFSLCVTAEAPLRENVGSKSAISLKRGPVDPKFHNLSLCYKVV